MLYAIHGGARYERETPSETVDVSHEQTSCSNNVPVEQGSSSETVEQPCLESSNETQNSSHTNALDIASSIKTIPIPNHMVIANIPYFSLDSAITYHQDGSVIHDVHDFLRHVKRECSEQSDRLQCSIALQRTIGTANALLEDLIDHHDSCWSTISEEYKVICNKSEDCKQLQIEILSLKRKPLESLHDLYTRAVRLGAKLLRQKPNRKEWVQEELSESFAKAVSVKFFHSLADTDKDNLRAILPKAIQYEYRQSEIKASKERRSPNPPCAPESKDIEPRNSDNCNNVSHKNLIQFSSTTFESKPECYPSKSKPKLCFKCQSPDHLQRFCNRSPALSGNHFRGQYFIALFSCFRCGSKQHQTFQCYRNNKICSRCECRGHLAIECKSTQWERFPAPRNCHMGDGNFVPDSQHTVQQEYHVDTSKPNMDHLTRAFHSLSETDQDKLISRRYEKMRKAGEDRATAHFVGGIYA